MIRINTLDSVMFIPEHSIESVQCSVKDKRSAGTTIHITLQSGNSVDYVTQEDPDKVVTCILDSLVTCGAASDKYIVIDSKNHMHLS